jgi:conjugal transfer/entry exclusion protein
MRLRRVTVCVLLSLLLTTQVQASGLPVVDAALNTQAMIQVENQIRAYAAMLKQLQNESVQLQQQIQQIQHAATTVQHGAQNLVQLKFSNLQDLLGLMDQLEGKYSQARAIRNTVAQSASDIQRLYPQAMQQLDAAKQRELALSWAATQRDVAGVAVRAQAMQETQQRYRQEWQQLLMAAQASKGNLEIEQAQMQALGQMGMQLAGIEQQLATNNRQLSQRELREATQMELDAAAALSSGREVDWSHYTPQGQAFAMPQTR